MLSTLTTSELGERVVYKILSEGVYRKHLERIRARLDHARPQAIRRVEALGLTLESMPSAGMFLWVDAGRDTSVLAAQAMEQGLLLAPGSLFSPDQLPSTRMRLNVAAVEDARLWDFLGGATNT
jgi:DNA-binding transcriptional MocR family regulator